MNREVVYQPSGSVRVTRGKERGRSLFYVERLVTVTSGQTLWAQDLVHPSLDIAKQEADWAARSGRR